MWFVIFKSQRISVFQDLKHILNFTIYYTGADNKEAFSFIVVYTVLLVVKSDNLHHISICYKKSTCDHYD